MSPILNLPIFIKAVFSYYTIHCQLQNFFFFLPRRYSLGRRWIRPKYEDCGLSLPSVECDKMGSISTFESIESYFPLVDKIVKREIRKLGMHQQLFEELRSYGIEGLVNASRMFDPERGVSFEIYACKRIRWAVYDGVRKMGWFPRHTLSRMRFFRKADEILEAKSTDPAPRDKTEAVHRLSGAVKELATAYIVSYSEDQFKDAHTDGFEPEEAVDMNRIHGVLRTYVNSLPEKERRVLIQFFFEDFSLTEIAAEMDVTLSWVSKLLASGLGRLRIIFDKRPDLL